MNKYGAEDVRSALPKRAVLFGTALLFRFCDLTVFGRGHFTKYAGRLIIDGLADGFAPRQTIVSE